jgi:hypothetical protein
MRRILLTLLAVLLVPLAPSLCGVGAALAAGGDVPGAKDYPGIGRFKGSVITGYEVKDFDATKLQAAAFKDGKATDERKPEGRVTRIAYKTGAGPSILEVAKNFETQLAKAGFTTLLTCTTDECGGIPFTEAPMSCRSRRCGSTASTIAIGRDVRLAKAAPRPMPPCS